MVCRISLVEVGNPLCGWTVLGAVKPTPEAWPSVGMLNQLGFFLRQEVIHGSRRMVIGYPFSLHRG